MIDLLTRKDVIDEEELPKPVVDLLTRRRNMRKMLRELRAAGMLDDL